MRSFASLASLCLLTLALGSALPSLARADGDAPSLATLGPAKSLGDDFYELSYKEQVPGKKRPRSAKAYVKVSDATQFFADRPGDLSKLATGTALWIYGEPVEAESVTDNGQKVIDRQVRGVRALAAGPAIHIAPSQAKEGARWVQGTVSSKPGGALEVTLEGSSYRVLTVRGCPLIERVALPERPEKLPKKFLAAVVGRATDAKPEKAKDGIDSHEATYLVILHKRLSKAYGLMLP